LDSQKPGGAGAKVPKKNQPVEEKNLAQEKTTH